MHLELLEPREPQVSAAPLWRYQPSAPQQLHSSFPRQAPLDRTSWSIASRRAGLGPWQLRASPASWQWRLAPAEKWSAPIYSRAASPTCLQPLASLAPAPPPRTVVGSFLQRPFGPPALAACAAGSPGTCANAAPPSAPPRWPGTLRSSWRPQSPPGPRPGSAPPAARGGAAGGRAPPWPPPARTVLCCAPRTWAQAPWLRAPETSAPLSSSSPWVPPVSGTGAPVTQATHSPSTHLR